MSKNVNNDVSKDSPVADGVVSMYQQIFGTNIEGNAY